MTIDDMFRKVLGIKGEVPKDKRARTLRRLLDKLAAKEAKLEKKRKKADDKDEKAKLDDKLALYAKHRKKAAKLLKSLEKK